MKPSAIAALLPALLAPFALAACPQYPPPGVLRYTASQQSSATDDSPPPILLDQQLDGLVAYAKLLGYVRYFHPSDEAAAADWDALAVDAVPRVEQARTPEELSAALGAAFAPVAPTLRVYPKGQAPPAPPEPTATQATWVGWVHYGLSYDSRDKVNGSVRASNTRTPHVRPAALVQHLDRGALGMAEGSELRGRRVHAKASLRAKVKDASAKAMLMIAWSSPRKGLVRAVSRPVTTADWQDVEVVAELDGRAEDAVVGLLLDGDGVAGIDDVSVTVEGGDASSGPAGSGALEDAGFEEAALSAWTADGYRGQQSIAVSHDKPHGGKASGELTSPVLPLEPIPKPADGVLDVDLGAGIEASVPTSLYTNDAGRTLPVGALVPEPSYEPVGARSARYSPNDRAVRLADVALAWNAFEHFDPHLAKTRAEWAASLRTALTRAIADTDEKTFHTTLKRLLADAHDGHATVRRAVYDARHGEIHPLGRGVLPLAWQVVEGKLVVTAVGPEVTEVHVGDVVLAIDGVPSERALADAVAVESAATPQYASFRVAASLLAGDPGDAVTLSISRGGAQPADVRLTRAAGRPPLEARPPSETEVAPGVFYIDVGAFRTSAMAMTPKVVGARAVIFDLRGREDLSPKLLAHLVDKPQTLAPWLTPKIEKPDSPETQLVPDEAFLIEPAAPRVKGKLAFLIDGRIDDHAEAAVARVAELHLGTLVGQPTGGAIGDAAFFGLPGGYYVTFTEGDVMGPGGASIFGAGITPSVPCAPTLAGMVAGKDEILACAIAALK